MNTNITPFPTLTRQDFLKKMVIQLVRRRKQLGLTQEELNYKIGVADRLIGKWECGMRTPNSFNLLCWAEALNAEFILVANDNKVAPNAAAVQQHFDFEAANDDKSRLAA
ncbi:MAG: helix-turn-helix transcriptional regulator [Cyclobacteriaceae bacterium]